MNNIILIGFMGSGKTSVGKRLSYKYKMTFLDTDKIIEQKAGLKITEIFDRFGEERFRRMETELLKKLIEEEQSQIISVGGGLPLREENRDLLKQLGTVIYLRVKPRTVCKRLKNDKSRPLLQGDNPEEKVKELLNLRKPIYSQAADLSVDVDRRSFNKILELIDRRLKQQKDFHFPDSKG